MYLIKISANKSNFKTIKFNKFGLNFIVAKQKNDDNYDVSKTYNGVGKSLVIKIIHFCLGADSKHYNSFCSELVDWEFYLDFEIKGTIYRSERKTSDPNRVILNGKELSINNFNKIMLTPYVMFYIYPQFFSPAARSPSADVPGKESPPAFRMTGEN